MRDRLPSAGRRLLLRQTAAWGSGLLTVGLGAGAGAAQPSEAPSRRLPEGRGGPSLRDQSTAAGDPYRIHDLDWTDSKRGREVPARLYLPAESVAGQQVPLVLFSHGIGGSRQGYSYLGSHLAASGHASLHLQHVGSDRRLWTSGNPFALLDRLQRAAREDEAIARVGDARFALDELLGSPLGARIDASMITAAGHSYGANTALLLSGARVLRQGQPVELQDPRIRAAVLISAPPFHGEAEPERILSGVRIPTLHITCTEDVIRIPGYNSGLADRLSIFEQVEGQPKVLSVFEGGSHSVFTDRAGTGGLQANPRIKKATQDLVTTFLQDLGRPGSMAGLRLWPQRHGDIVSSFVIRA